MDWFVVFGGAGGHFSNDIGVLFFDTAFVHCSIILDVVMDLRGSPPFRLVIMW